MITNNNFASTAINENKIYCGKGTALISKKNVKTNKGKDIFNNEKMLLSMTKIRIDDGKETNYSCNSYYEWFRPEEMKQNKLRHTRYLRTLLIFQNNICGH